jgi:hypothetical protein
MKKINEEIKRVKQLMSINEADISGVDELVYNPATEYGGDIGHGYKKGIKIPGFKLKKHENHLHVSFTDKKTAMEIIDKADQMGLITSENPYAKKDPNGRVDPVHVSSSLHYQNFDGQPLVGKAVDIRGDKQTIVQLIKWIEQNYSGQTKTTEPTQTTQPVKPFDNPKTKDEENFNDLLDLKIGEKKLGDWLQDIPSGEEKPSVSSSLGKFLSMFSK